MQLPLAATPIQRICSLTALGAFLIQGCAPTPTPDPDPEPGLSASAEIGEGGGSVEAKNASADVPAGALGQAIEISVSEIDAAEVAAQAPEGVDTNGPMFAFEPHGTAFSSPVTLRLQVEPGTNVVLRADDESDATFEVLSGAIIEGNVATVQVMGFSVLTGGVQTETPVVDAGPGPQTDAGEPGADAGSDAGTVVLTDQDGDGIEDSQDNCVEISNPQQEDQDQDGVGDFCDLDIDGDGTNEVDDNCPGLFNPNQADINDDGIGDACQTSACGDRIVQFGELCDDGDTQSGDGCSSNCTTELGWNCGAQGTGPCLPVCGDGRVVGNEQCDSTDGCTGICTRSPGYLCIANNCRPLCGDGRILDNEECDDGNLSSGDGCSITCRRELGFDCDGAGTCETVCGDGYRRGVEQCDDGNSDNGDGCTDACTVATGYSCTGANPDVCTAVCGDGLLRGDEQCDDGNTENGDGCSASCNNEAGFDCGQGCVAICGDGLVVGNEECDDGPGSEGAPGATVGGDGCSANCTEELGYACTGAPSVCAGDVGDGLLRGDEECDDRNTADGDGCSSLGRVEDGYFCKARVGGCDVLPVYGDGLIKGNEECDTGDDNLDAADGCVDGQVLYGYRCPAANAACEPIFGDGVVVGTEYCDTGDNDADADDGCVSGMISDGFKCVGEGTGSCQSICGDGLLLGDEQCDDGNRSPADGCSRDCNVEFGYSCDYSQSPEDAGNPDAGISELGQLCAPIYGDGVALGDEECDTGDNNTDANDGCIDGRVQPTFVCAPRGGSCEPIANDGYVNPNYGSIVNGQYFPHEQCDDGNEVLGDGCSNGRIETGFACEGGTQIDGSDPSVCDAAIGYACSGTGQYGAECAPLPVVGDGRVVEGETCDDGNALGSDGCGADGQEEFGYDCVRAGEACGAEIGDGYVLDGLEQCDDGNRYAGDGCSNLGQVETGFACLSAGEDCAPIYGDGLVVRGEACDTGDNDEDAADGCVGGVVSQGYSCPLEGGACAATTIGNGYLDPVPGIERCDDGNEADADGCSDGQIDVGFICVGGDLADGSNPSVCTADTARGWACTGFGDTGAACQPRPVPGDGILAGAEICDDGNLNAGDGCTRFGQVEAGYACNAPGTPCDPIIGDGIRVGNETCDDANQAPADGCSSLGQVEIGFICQRSIDIEGAPVNGADLCRPIFGDGRVVLGEYCDTGDQNRDFTDGCIYGRVTPGYTCVPTGGACAAALGDGYVLFGKEACDDGNIVNADGCSAGVVDDGFYCVGGTLLDGSNPSVCTQCVDTQPDSDADGCDNNGLIVPGYVCPVYGAPCQQEVGDGYAVPGVEVCDDANTIANDGCTNGAVDVGYVCVGGDQEDGSNPSQCSAAPGYECSGTGTYGAECAPIPVYGDGQIVAGEQCDDGNTENGDGCSSTGQFEDGFACGDTAPSVCEPVYGDGQIVAGETCDTGDANLDAEDGCVDGAIVAGFACPAAGIPCEPIYGDGLVVGDEECDDGNTDAADGCAGNSTVEDGWTCDAAEPSVCSVVYGDGYVVAGEEQCDDGNTEAGDGCSANGEVEPGYTCNGGNLVTGGAPSICKVVYGDGYVVGGVEQCDDANDANGDGCKTNGVIEDGYACIGGDQVDGSNPSVCSEIYGDGLIVGGEQCDTGDEDKNAVDGCVAGVITTGFICPAAGFTCLPIIGDGLIVGTEQCDDGNQANDDGCSANGQLEDGYTCPTPGAACTTICGDGKKRGAEQCDDGNTANGDGCSATCTVENYFTCNGQGPGSCAAICGDGYTVAGYEVCDDGNTANGDGCSSVCANEQGYECTGVGENSDCNAICGDGLVREDEQCDDGNTNNGDGCSATCTEEVGFNCVGQGANTCAPICGDGLKVLGEQCDDGNTNNNDGCTQFCTVEQGYACPVAGQACNTICGDGLVRGNEQCDDGNTNNGDGCSNVCAVEDDFQCVGEGAGSCSLISTLFLTSTKFKPQNGQNFAAMDAQCKQDYGNTAFHCTRAQIQERASAGQADPGVFTQKAWVKDFDTFGGKPGNCNNLTYNSGHLFRAHYITVNANGTTAEGQQACNTPNWPAHCCLP